MIFCCPLPETKNMFITFRINAQGNQIGLAGPMDCIDKYSKRVDERKVPFLEFLELPGGNLNDMPGKGTGGYAYGVGRVDNRFMVLLQLDAPQCLLQELFRK